MEPGVNGVNACREQQQRNRLKLGAEGASKLPEAATESRFTRLLWEQQSQPGGR